MNTQQLFAKMLRARSKLKNVTQISWEFQAFDRRYPFESCAQDDESYQFLLDTYEGMLKKLLDLVREGDE